MDYRLLRALRSKGLRYQALRPLGFGPEGLKPKKTNLIVYNLKIYTPTSTSPLWMFLISDESKISLINFRELDINLASFFIKAETQQDDTHLACCVIQT